MINMINMIKETYSYLSNFCISDLHDDDDNDNNNKIIFKGDKYIYYNALKKEILYESKNKNIIFKYVESIYINDFYMQENMNKRLFHEMNYQYYNLYYSKKLLMDISNDIKKIYSHITWYDIYLTLIYIYYGVMLNEPDNDWLDSNFLRQYAYKYTDVINLYISIVCKDILTDNNKNLSSYIRRLLLGFNIE